MTEFCVGLMPSRAMGGRGHALHMKPCLFWNLEQNFSLVLGSGITRLVLGKVFVFILQTMNYVTSGIFLLHWPLSCSESCLQLSSNKRMGPPHVSAVLIPSLPLNSSLTLVFSIYLSPHHRHCPRSDPPLPLPHYCGRQFIVFPPCSLTPMYFLH